MVYDRNGRDESYGAANRPDYSEDYGSGRRYTASNARDYQAAGEWGDDGRRGYRDDGRREEWREVSSQGRDYYGGREPAGDRAGAGRSSRGERYGQPDRGRYAEQGRRFEGEGRDRDRGDGRPLHADDCYDRGFLQRAGDEVRSWFGDDDAERRRERDAQEEGRFSGQGARDHDYHHWRRQQIAAFDRDYDEYRREHRDKFHTEFSEWRLERQGQRDLLTRVEEHMHVLGADGAHVGTVDKVRGDRILLTRNDPDAGGHHHSIPSRWIQSVDGKVTLRKSGQEAKDHWRDEERQTGDDPAGK